MRNVREFIINSSQTFDHDYIKISELPSELTYADDCDFATENIIVDQLITKEVSTILKTHNLHVNDDKTEKITLMRDADKNKEDWRKVKKLGSLLGDTEDVIRRKQLASAAFEKMNSIWIRRRKIHIRKRMKLYNTLVKPILTYNSCTWGLTKKELESLDAFHRSQLRKVWKFNWKMKVTNNKLYELSQSEPLSQEIKRARLKMLGHTLRMDKEAPAQKAMSYYFENIYEDRKYKGRRRTTIVSVINEDISKLSPERDVPLINSVDNLEKIRRIASDRKNWNNIIEEICNM